MNELAEIILSVIKKSKIHNVKEWMKTFDNLNILRPLLDVNKQ